MRVSSKSSVETLRIGNVQTTFTWQGTAKKPTITYQLVEHTIPEEGSLDSVMASEPLIDTNIAGEEEI